MNLVLPRLETLPPAQKRIWPQLSGAGADFVLYGGTALSLQLGGRTSIDFDLFASKPLDHDQLAIRFPFLKGTRSTQRSSNTATFVAGTESEKVAISFFGGLDIGRVSEPVRFVDNGLFAAGLLDLAAQKIKVIQQRAEVKDYLDIHTLLTNGISLEMALGAARALYPEFNPAISLKALSYFGDVRQVPPGIQRELSMAAATVRDFEPILKLAPSLLPDSEFSPDRFPSLERDDPELEI
jgi:hypothetical protein